MPLQDVGVIFIAPESGATWRSGKALARETGEADMKQKPRAVMYGNFCRLTFLWVLSLAVPAFAAQATDVSIAVDNRPQVNVCIPPGQNPQEVANALGIGEHQLVASGPNGTIIRAPGDAKTIEKTAQEKGVNLCFVETDFCMIMTPLTPFRGHDHEAHHKAGKPVHGHEPHDPGPDWGVTPPMTAIRWEAEQ